jgi:hypothetical protein
MARSSCSQRELPLYLRLKRHGVFDIAQGPEIDAPDRQAKLESRQCRRFEVPLAVIPFEEFQSECGTGIIELLMAPLLPKFVSESAVMDHEVRKRGTNRASGRGA